MNKSWFMEKVKTKNWQFSIKIEHREIWTTYFVVNNIIIELCLIRQKKKDNW